HHRQGNHHRRVERDTACEQIKREGNQEAECRQHPESAQHLTDTDSPAPEASHAADQYRQTRQASDKPVMAMPSNRPKTPMPPSQIRARLSSGSPGYAREVSENAARHRSPIARIPPPMRVTGASNHPR